MRRGGFTLIELIFVIVVIGILAAVAIPKFKNLKQNAESKSVIKTTIDAAQQAVEAAINFMDLEDDKNITLEDLVTIKGKGWQYENTSDGKYSYTDPQGTYPVAEIIFDRTNRIVEYKITCDNFHDQKTQKKCKKDLNTTDPVDVNLTF